MKKLLIGIALLAAGITLAAVETNEDFTITKPFGQVKSKEKVTVGLDTSNIVKRGTTVFEEDEDDYTGNPGMFGFGVSYKLNAGAMSMAFGHSVGSSWYFSDNGYEYGSNLMTDRQQKIGDLTWNCAYIAANPNYNMTTVPYVFGTNVTGFASSPNKPRVLELPDWETSADGSKIKQNGNEVFADREWVFVTMTNLIQQLKLGKSVTFDPATGKITIQ